MIFVRKTKAFRHGNGKNGSLFFDIIRMSEKSDFFEEGRVHIWKVKVLRDGEGKIENPPRDESLQPYFVLLSFCFVFV